jgi:DNA polymerase III alpha subunit
MQGEDGQDIFELQDRNLWMKSEEEINEKWLERVQPTAEYPQGFSYSDVIPLELFETAKLNTVKICEKAKGVVIDRESKLPQIDDAKVKFAEALDRGMKWRGLNRSARYQKRLAEEFDLITRKGFASYFLIQQMFTNEARRICPDILGWGTGDEALGPGRGSACGSLATYVMGITDVDPIKHGLLFSRFLSESRGGKALKTRFTQNPIPFIEEALNDLATS